jgi:hypothetical protein
MADEDGTGLETIDGDEGLFGDAKDAGGGGSGDQGVSGEGAGEGAGDGKQEDVDNGADSTATALRKLGIESVDEVAALQEQAKSNGQSDTRLSALEGQIRAITPTLAAAAAGKPAGATATKAESEEFLRDFLLNPKSSMAAVHREDTRAAIKEALNPLLSEVQTLRDDQIVNEFATREGTGFMVAEDTAILNKFLTENPFIGNSRDPLGDAWKLIQAQRPDFYAKRDRREARRAASNSTQADMKNAAGAGGKGTGVTAKGDASGDEFDQVLDRNKKIETAFS